MKILKQQKIKHGPQPDLTYKDFTPKQLIEIHHTAIFNWVHLNLVIPEKLGYNQLQVLKRLYHIIVTETTIMTLYNMPAEEFITRLINHFNK